MSATELLLIDLSSLAHPLFHISGNEPDPNWTSTQIVARVRALSGQHPHAAICCDTGKSFRNDLAPRVALGDGKYAGYKADRPERDARLYHQIAIAVARLRDDGYPIWSAENFEADDVIATATVRALQTDPDITVLIASADKDLLQLVSPRVRWKSVAPQSDGVVRDEAAVVAKFGVTSAQLHDWLCLVGDTSDNVVGAKGIGSVTATKLLKAHGSLDAIYAAMDKGVAKDITPALRSSLVEFKDRRALVSQLITLRSDVEIPFEEIAAERTAKPMEDAVSDGHEPGELTDDNATVIGQELDQNGVAERIHAAEKQSPAPVGRVVAEQPAPVSSAPVEFSQQLEPRTMNEAVTLAQRLFDSKLALGSYGAPQAVLAVILAGREIGLPAMASLRAFHIIEGKPTLSAGIIQSLVLKSGKARYFRCSERTDTSATFETQRGDDPPASLSYTMAEAERAGLVKDKGGWKKNPADMLVARASSKLARLVYPDVVSGLYAPEEME